MTGLQIQMLLQGLKKIKGETFPVKVSYAIAKNIQAVESEMEVMQGLLQDLINEYEVTTIEPKENGELFIELKDEKLAKEFAEKMSEIETMEYDIPLTKISLSDLDGVFLSPEALYLLEPIIKE